LIQIKVIGDHVWHGSGCQHYEGNVLFDLCLVALNLRIFDLVQKCSRRPAVSGGGSIGSAWLKVITAIPPIKPLADMMVSFVFIANFYILEA
jgi:hypothetical protein